MSIIIKNVDLPENFEAIAIITRTENKGKDCYNTVASYYGSRDVIQIPKGHGDIVDRDELIIRRDIISQDIMGHEIITGQYEAINDNPNILLESEEE